MSQTILDMRNIRKCFGPVKALSGVNLKVGDGEIHAICGENGAGKSTLMKILSGVYPHGSFEGEIHFDGSPRCFQDLRDSEALGVCIIHQELALVPMLSITENLFLGNEISRHGVIDWHQAHARANDLLARVGLDTRPQTLVGNLGIGQQQLVEIAKALAKDVRLLILDEPTASLNEKDSDRLLKLMLELKSRGITSIIISHKLNEIGRVADQITVIRDGTTVDVIDCRDVGIDEGRVVRSMVGRELSDRYPARVAAIGGVLFEVQGWSVGDPARPERDRIRNVNFHVRRGEVVGIAGLMGAGRTEFAMSVFGRSYGVNIRGKALLEGREVDLGNVRKAIDQGLAYATEDRKGAGLVLGESITRNTSMANLAAVSSRWVMNELAETAVAVEYRSRLRIRSADVTQSVEKLSGGNQQKVVLGKWLFANPKVLILDEPTRGIDVGAKYEIYGVVNQVVSEGRGVVMISSEMPELLGTCDRIYVMNEGRFVGEFAIAEASQEKIMHAIMRNEVIQ
ncbi:multiple monosaccharide ABC transporter ATP-binding protein [Pseudomonas fragi]|jgi:putative multiple sugar transport system ATP-binding protein|uniref:ATP-binding cassette domain-containing protein n=1 Tax=Pseudomonas fragi TaxID=296 RepID=A0A9Q5B512_PSEFR|nr:multiple monosaccharide ABC transporter ATP-binding protein [Pseudomonas fragi]MBM1202466.1 ATP-binding cassette domain-containing protein [Pseudomonas fragi]MDE4515186.1 ATP-binding cassette domain-containing protein [Pseudomonas fragi]NNB15896.1 ATP-binding cassette domain-containing protein [Pseudomonas fragi]NNB18406.1 ATP-binding cassette domain-containing protein [Pseudomonas fragi]NNB26479.1 ATP-binding cassette domain-containing protein [Pseudomonas fragi]